jgi:hypothetical protein
MKKRKHERVARPCKENPEWTAPETKKAHPPLEVVNEVSGKPRNQQMRPVRGQPPKGNRAAAEYAAFHRAHDFFNGKLFSGSLTNALLTLHHQATAYFSPERFTRRADRAAAHELPANLDTFGAAPIENEVSPSFGAFDVNNCLRYSLVGAPGRAALGLLPGGHSFVELWVHKSRDRCEQFVRIFDTGEKIVLKERSYAKPMDIPGRSPLGQRRRAGRTFVSAGQRRFVSSE